MWSEYTYMCRANLLFYYHGARMKGQNIKVKFDQPWKYHSNEHKHK
jgi:hypothetical protein